MKRDGVCSERWFLAAAAAEVGGHWRGVRRKGARVVCACGMGVGLAAPRACTVKSGQQCVFLSESAAKKAHQKQVLPSYVHGSVLYDSTFLSRADDKSLDGRISPFLHCLLCVC